MDWFGGFAKSQKRKCELSLHLNFNKELDNKVLEISCSSLNSLGNQLSAMNLKKQTSRGVLLQTGHDMVGLLRIVPVIQDIKDIEDLYLI